MKESVKENVKTCNNFAEKSNECLKAGFKGFVSNRFGRLGELSKASENHKELLNAFFDQQNKLMLAPTN